MVVSKRLKYFEVTCLSDCDPGNWFQVQVSPLHYIWYSSYVYGWTSVSLIPSEYIACLWVLIKYSAEPCTY
jgi:hypothetical protein